MTQQLKKFIRITGERDGKFIEFDFAIGDPSLFVELVLPKNAFDDFCQKNQVVEMTQEQKMQNDEEAQKWRYGNETTLVGAQRYNLDHDD